MAFSLFFHLLGVGPDAFFYVGKEGTGVGPEGENIPYPGSEPGKPLGKHEASTIQLKLPKGYKRENLGWLSVWCKKFNVDFGHVSFLKKTQTTTPPPNPDDKYEDYSEEEVNKGSSSNLKVALIILYLTQMMIALLIWKKLNYTCYHQSIAFQLRIDETL